MEKKIIIVKDNMRVRPRKSEVSRLLADNNKAKKILKWKPGFSGIKGLRKGLLSTINWFEENHELYKEKYKVYNI